MIMLHNFAFSYHRAAGSLAVVLKSAVVVEDRLYLADLVQILDMLTHC